MPRLSLVAAFTAILAASGALAQVPDDAFASRVASRILDELVAVNRVPGMSAAVWRGDKVVWAGASGWADIGMAREATPETWYRFASVSKLFAVTAAAKLREQGKLNTTKPVALYLPWLTKEWPAMTSEQLAAHTSGIPHYQLEDQWRGGKRYPSQREAVALFEGRKLLAEPGAAYSYSSWGYTLLGALVEAASGREYLDYLAAEITPGLSIGRDVTDTSEPNASIAYEIGSDGPRRADPHDYSYSLGGAGLGGTAPALATWGGRILRGELVSLETLNWMLTPVRLNDGSAAGEDGFQVGFGWRLETDPDGGRFAHHAGVTSGARSALMLMPERAIAASVLSNASWVSAIDDTAAMLAAPFVEAPDMPPEMCPVEAVSYSAMMNDDAMTGSAAFAMEDGICVGRIALSEDGALAKWLSDTADTPVRQVAVIGLHSGGTFVRGALVTPIGVYDLRRKGEVMSVKLNPTRSMTLTLAR